MCEHGVPHQVPYSSFIVVKYHAVQNSRVLRQKTDDFAIKVLSQMNASAVPRDTTAMLPRKPCTAQVPLTATDSPLLNKHQINTVVWGAEAAATSGKYMFGQRPEHWSRNPTFPAEHEVLLVENTWLSMLGM
jgi:hypothetical protein